jgi:DNA repair protein RadA/Sms
VAKTRVSYVCTNCGATAPGWLGRCPRCGEWNSLEQRAVAPEAAADRPARERARAVSLNAVSTEEEHRLPVPMTELERVLGGGLVPGSVVLLAGEPGIGKSTLVLQLAMFLAENGGQVLYASGEESARQVGLRAKRLGNIPDSLLVLAEPEVESIVEEIEGSSPTLVVVDSVQAVRLAERAGSAGSVVQVRDSAAALTRAAKAMETPLILIGHVTKSGAIAGPRVLEHMVDTVLYMEGDRYHAHRILRSVKNRFGSTNEVGVFEMTAEGLKEVVDPSEVFLAERLVGASGSAVAVTMEGTRPMLVEVQALASRSTPERVRRTGNGFDFRRLLLLTAVLSKRVGLPLGQQDIFVNIVGGLTLTEPAADLAVSMAIASAALDKPISADVALLGEVGLSGEVRSVGQIERRIQEAARLGFRTCLVPRSYGHKPRSFGKVELAPVRSLQEAMHVLELR